MEELIELYHFRPQYFPGFEKIIPDEAKHLKYGLTVARRLIGESKQNLQRAQDFCDLYRDHLQHYLLKSGVKTPFFRPSISVF